MKIGYVRVSTEEQNTARQEIMLRELGVDELFVDRASGKNADRPELNRMMNFVRRGDTVIVESISRFARNTRDGYNGEYTLPPTVPDAVVMGFFSSTPQKFTLKSAITTRPPQH